MNELKNKIKLDLINYFDGIKSDIDLKVQELLLEYESENSKVADENYRSRILKTNKEFITNVDDVFSNCVININEYFSSATLSAFQVTEDEVKEAAFKCFCTFIKSDQLRRQVRKKNPIGVLILTDWYLDENQLNYLRNYFMEDYKSKNKLKFYFDKEVLSIRYGLDYYDYNSNEFDGQFTLNRSNIISRLSSLKKLDLDIYEGPDCLEKFRYDTFVNCKQLNELDLRGETDCLKAFKSYQIDYLERDIFNALSSSLSELSVYNIKGNENILNYVKDLKQLKSLVLVDVSIKKISDDAFINLKNLKRLDLSWNKIGQITGRLLEGLESLEILILNGNQLETLDQETFNSCSCSEKLKLLDLSLNNLDYLKKNTFMGLVNLEKLYLSKCNIRSIELNAFNGLGKLEKLNFSRNPYGPMKLNDFKKQFSLNNLNYILN